ncbi:MAG: cysteine--tRNA ligase [Gemmatimonadota bacterium]
MALHLLNTLSGEKELFEPLDPPRVRMYTCGPTVHDRAHVGNFRTFLFEDVLRRYLEYLGYDVTHVMNVTDVDDKIILKARAAGLPIGEYTRRFTELFFDDARTLGMRPAHHYPRATAYVPQMMELVERLSAGGHTYESDGSVYFRIASFPEYGKLSGVDLAGARDGARVDADEYDKEDPKDFVLWKAARPGEHSWESRWGPGRPGWHLECSAMAMDLLGESFDLHAGGVDNVFPHHENEIAQSESATGRPFARYWVHAQHLVVGERKMAKSLGNFSTLGDLLQEGHDPRAVRYLLVAAHYRTPLQLTEEGLRQAAAALERLRAFKARLREAGAGPAAPRTALRDGEDPATPGSAPVAELLVRAEEGFREGMDDDLNVPRALAAVFGLVREANALLDQGAVDPAAAAALLARLRSWDDILGVLGDGADDLPPSVAQLVEERENARARRDFGRSDELRSALRELGWQVEDTSGGPRIRRLPPG